MLGRDLMARNNFMCVEPVELAGEPILDADECEGVRPFLGKALQSSTGHRLWVVAVLEREGELIVLCAACGRRDTGVGNRTPFWVEQCHGACTRKTEESKKRFFWDATS